MNLLFDLDGTLADPFEAFSTSLHSAFAELGLQPPPDNDIRACIGPPIQKSVVSLLGERHNELGAKFIALYRKHHTDIGIFKYRFFPEIDEALPQLQIKHQLYVATSKPLPLAEKVLKHFGKDKYFKKIYGPELDGLRADKADLLSYLLHQEKLIANDCVMIGDREHDIHAAQKNHIKSIGVLWGFGSREELEKAKANHIVNTWAELLDLC